MCHTQWCSELLPGSVKGHHCGRWGILCGPGIKWDRLAPLRMLGLRTHFFLQFMSLGFLWSLKWHDSINIAKYSTSSHRRIQPINLQWIGGEGVVSESLARYLEVEEIVQRLGRSPGVPSLHCGVCPGGPHATGASPALRIARVALKASLSTDGELSLQRAKQDKIESQKCSVYCPVTTITLAEVAQKQGEMRWSVPAPMPSLSPLESTLHWCFTDE